MLVWPFVVGWGQKKSTGPFATRESYVWETRVTCKSSSSASFHSSGKRWSWGRMLRYGWKGDDVPSPRSWSSRSTVKHARVKRGAGGLEEPLQSTSGRKKRSRRGGKHKEIMSRDVAGMASSLQVAAVYRFRGDDNLQVRRGNCFRRDTAAKCVLDRRPSMCNPTNSEVGRVDIIGELDTNPQLTTTKNNHHYYTVWTLTLLWCSRHPPTRPPALLSKGL